MSIYECIDRQTQANNKIDCCIVVLTEYVFGCSSFLQRTADPPPKAKSPVYGRSGGTKKII